MDLYRLSPELALGIVAALVILLDLVVHRKGWLVFLSLLGLAMSAGFSIAILGQGAQGTAFNGFLVVDNVSLLFKFLFLGIAALLILGSVDYADRFARHQGEYYALILLSTVGMMLMASTRELISVYIALELTSISLYILASFLRDTKSTEAGIKYILLGAISSAVLLYGMALLYGLTGETDFTKLAQALKTAATSNYPVLLLGMVFLVAGFGFKIAAVPFQMWVPDVYEGAPTPVTAFLAVASKAAGFAVVLRVFYEALGAQSADWSILFAIISAVGMTLGNVVAILQNNIKRMLAYSSIAQAGYLLVGLASISFLGPAGILFFFISYALTTLGAFIAIIAIANQIRSDEIDDYAGLGRRAPFVAFVLALCMLSLTGVPPTSGFIAKIYIFNAAVQGGLVWLVILAVINTVISAYYYMRVIKVMYLRESPLAGQVPASAALTLALIVTLVGVLWLGVIPAPFIAAAEAAARGLVGQSPF